MSDYYDSRDKKPLHDRDDKIRKLEDEVKLLKVKLKTCKTDYWFMTNLLEKYSTDKDEAIKHCIERMNFRKPLFETETFHEIPSLILRLSLRTTLKRLLDFTNEYYMEYGDAEDCEIIEQAEQTLRHLK